MARTSNPNNKPPFGARIVNRLLEMKKTQKWLSATAQINQIYLNAIIAGRAIPSVKMVQKIAVLLDLDTAELIILLIGE